MGQGELSRSLNVRNLKSYKERKQRKNENLHSYMAAAGKHPSEANRCILIAVLYGEYINIKHSSRGLDPSRIILRGHLNSGTSASNVTHAAS